MSHEQELAVRAMDTRDLPRVRELCAELGYETTAADLGSRFAALQRDPRCALYVAERARDVLGFIQVEIRTHIQSPVHAEIIALSVTSSARRTGAGRALCDRAVEFAVDAGVPVVRVRSNVTRDASHAFYTSIGFTRTKTSHAYERRVAGGRSSEREQ